MALRQSFSLVLCKKTCDSPTISPLLLSRAALWMRMSHYCLVVAYEFIVCWHQTMGGTV